MTELADSASAVMYWKGLCSGRALTPLALPVTNTSADQNWRSTNIYTA